MTADAATQEATEHRFADVPVPAELVDEVLRLIRRLQDRDAATARRASLGELVEPTDAAVPGASTILTVVAGDGEVVAVEVPDDFTAQWDADVALRGVSFPHLPFVDDVRVVVDLGAQVGAAARYFARVWPNARVHAVEHRAAAFPYLDRNLDGHASIAVHHVDLGHPDWAQPLGLHRIDVLKVTVGGLEREAFEGLGALLSGVKAIYIDYGYQRSHHYLQLALEQTHSLQTHQLVLDLGRAIYLRNDLADRPDANARWLELLADRR